MFSFEDLLKVCLYSACTLRHLAFVLEGCQANVCSQGSCFLVAFKIVAFMRMLAIIDSICNLCWDVQGVGSVCVNDGTLGNKCPCQHKQHNFS